MKGKKSEKNKENKNIFLFIWLALLLTYNVIVLIKNIPLVASMNRLAPYLTWIIGLAEIILIIFLFRLRKWAFFGICVTTLILSVINAIHGLIIGVVIALVWLTILYLILKPRWKLLK